MLGQLGGFRSDQLQMERMGEPAGDFVLQGEQIASVAVEPLRPEMRDRSVVRFSVIASAKYCCSGSLLRLANGSTTIDKRGAAARWEISGAAMTLGAGSAATASGRNA